MKGKSLSFHLRKNNYTFLIAIGIDIKIRKLKKFNRNKLYLQRLFLCLFRFIFSNQRFFTIEYEWMLDDGSLDNLCEVPRADADGFLIFIIVPLSIPFLLVKRTPPRVIT
ncbi:DUF2645 family protein [Pectobacterium polaris]|uniref:DUF2645 family protein n=1 Tax=Pectobacterium polaris TaxID=2042057 RepID=UPI0032EC3FF1